MTEGNGDDNNIIDDLIPADVTAGYEYGHDDYPDWLDDAFAQFRAENGNDEGEENEEEGNNEGYAADEEEETQDSHIEDGPEPAPAPADSAIPHRNPSNLSTIRTMCSTYCHRLDLSPSPISIAIPLSRHLATNIHSAPMFHFCGPSAIAAVAVFVASHLLGAPRTLFRVEMMTGVEGRDVLSLYRIFLFAVIEGGLVDEVVVGMVGGREGGRGRGGWDEVVGRLPDASVL